MRQLELYNFKCFVNQKINFRNLTIFTGANAAGKSSIIQALLLYYRTNKENEHMPLDLNEILGVEVGNPKYLVAQRLSKIGEEDFRIAIDGISIDYVIDKYNPLNLFAKMDTARCMADMQYLNAERMGPRRYYIAGGRERFLPDGSNAVYLMERADELEFRIPETLMLDDRILKFSNQVECWLSLILGELSIQSAVDMERVQSEYKIKNELTDSPVIPAMTGFGISYELAIIVAGLWEACQNNGLLIVENPEAHLHPAAQSRIGRFLALVASTGTQVIVETHSEHVIDGARLQMALLEQNEDMLVNFLLHHNGNVMVTELNVDRQGNLDDWPEGFFDQKQQDLRALFELRRMNGNNK